MTDLIHVDDLTTNIARFDMLDEDTRRRLEALLPDEREWWDGVKWLPDSEASRIYSGITYRQKPKPKPETVFWYQGVYDFGACGSWDTLADARRDYPDALSIIRVETCTKTGKLIRAESVEVGDE